MSPKWAKKARGYILLYLVGWKKENKKKKLTIFAYIYNINYKNLLARFCVTEYILIKPKSQIKEFSVFVQIFKIVYKY